MTIVCRFGNKQLYVLILTTTLGLLLFDYDNLIIKSWTSHVMRYK